MRLGERQLDCVARLFDFVGDERRPELFDQSRPVDIEGEAELPRRIAFGDFARDVQRAVGCADYERAADLQSTSTELPKK